MAARSRTTTQPAGGFWRSLRIAVLLLILLGVAGDAWLTSVRTTSWQEPLWVSVYPINADGSAATAAYIGTLDNEQFAPVADFLAREAGRYGLAQTQPVQMRLAPEIRERPPAPPAAQAPLAVMLWSLKMRFWAWRMQHTVDGPPSNIQIFVQYFDPRLTDRVAHSLGLQKGLLGVVNAFAAPHMAGQNNVVIAHELLHTVGATDKYDLGNSRPLYPHGYADPERDPLHPQTRAEIMGGRIPLSETQADLPMSLHKVVVGPATAAEIRWIDPAS